MKLHVRKYEVRVLVFNGDTIIYYDDYKELFWYVKNEWM